MINKGNGCGLKLIECKGKRVWSGDQAQLTEIDRKLDDLVGQNEGILVQGNYIGDIVDGPGCVLDASTLWFDQNQVKKCQGGVIVTTAQRLANSDELSLIENFALVQIEKSTLH